MATNKVNYPSQFDTYGREISRRSSLYHNVDCGCYDPVQNNTRGSLCSVDYNLDNAGDIVSPLPIKDVNYNGCKSLYQRVHPNCTEETEIINDCTCPNEYHNNAFYFKYKNIRIRYVGFVYNKVNYIVDFDNRKVIYKPCQESCYVKLNRKISVSNNSITGAYSLGFNTVNCNISASVEIYPNDINHCTVTLTSLRDYSKEVLDECYTCIEYFDINNMTDKYGNLITFVDYNEVLSLTKEDLASIYSQNELVDILYSIIRNIKCNKDMTNVVKNILLSIKNKLNDNAYMGDEDNTYDMPICSDSCNCGCNNDNGDSTIKPPYIKPNQEAYQNFREESLVGEWISECGEYLVIKENGSAQYGRIKDSRALWSVRYEMSNDGKEYKDIILMIRENDTPQSTDMSDHYSRQMYEFSINPVTLDLINFEEGMSHNRFTKKEVIKTDFDMDIKFKFFYKDGSDREIIYQSIKKGIPETSIVIESELLKKEFEKIEVGYYISRNNSIFTKIEVASNIMYQSNGLFIHPIQVDSEFNTKEEIIGNFEIVTDKEIYALNGFFNMIISVECKGENPYVNDIDIVQVPIAESHDSYTS